MTTAAAAARLTLGRRIVVGRNTWYFIQGRRASWVLKAQQGVIHEIGVTQHFLTRTRREQTYLLHHL
jgi:hypothetical protein